jgi:hypothetical protein
MRLYIEQGGEAAKKIAGRDTYIYVVDDEGNKTDISGMVRGVDVRLHVGEVVTAKLDVFVTGFEGEAELEDLFLKEIRPRNWWRRKWRDVTTLGHRDGAKRFA